jgi:hypothetical protein
MPMPQPRSGKAPWSHSARPGGTAVGQGATVSGASGTALGTGASAGFANSTAIGAGAVTTSANQMMFGTASQTYVTPGITSAASLAAQSGPTYLVTTDASGHLAATNFNLQNLNNLSASVTGLQQSVGALQQGFGVLQQQVSKAYEGTAIAIAMGGTALPSDKNFAVSVNWDTFTGQNAAAVSTQLRLSDHVVFNGGVGAGFQQHGVGGRAGLTFAW